MTPKFDVWHVFIKEGTTFFFINYRNSKSLHITRLTFPKITFFLDIACSEMSYQGTSKNLWFERDPF